MLKGGDTGPALCRRNPAKSLIVKALRWTDDDLKMPPKNETPDEQIADVEAWIKRAPPGPARRSLAKAA